MHIAVIFDFTIQGFLQSDSVFQKPQKDKTMEGEGGRSSQEGQGKGKDTLLVN